MTLGRSLSLIIPWDEIVPGNWQILFCRLVRRRGPWRFRYFMYELNQLIPAVWRRQGRIHGNLNCVRVDSLARHFCKSGEAKTALDWHVWPTDGPTDGPAKTLLCTQLSWLIVLKCAQFLNHTYHTYHTYKDSNSCTHTLAILICTDLSIHLSRVYLRMHCDLFQKMIPEWNVELPLQSI